MVLVGVVLVGAGVEVEVMKNGKNGKDRKDRGEGKED